ncbi:NmrA family NAD(P)-binding protein [Acetobacter persici]|uniref:NmrA family NAD(P)-binding protein n=1 Tax=Acetobacter persici TaxID=1076596 RepID=UPI001BACF5EE|nr:NmrA family NAD(P)-binding protein [Acetobacter persici]MBS1016685.1 NmrA family NAD(P)-binding protein [Acetobacter persici]
MFVVMGATGHVGGSVARAVLAAGQAVTVITRSEAKAQLWREQGAEAAVLDVRDVPALAAVFQKARRAFVLNPPASPALNTDAEERRTMQAILRALQGAGLEKIVLQSTYGAQPGAHSGDLGVLYEFEEGARTLETPLCVVRAAYYMSNWAMGSEAIRSTGLLETMLPATQRVPMVAPQDVGAVAAQLLMAPVAETGLYSIEGPAWYSPADVAQALAAVLGRSVRVASLARADWLAAYRRAGFSEEAARSYAHMTDIFISQAYESPANPLKGATDLHTYFQQVFGLKQN